MKKLLCLATAFSVLLMIAGCHQNTSSIHNAIAIAADDSGTFLINAQKQRLYLNYDEIIGEFGDIIIVRSNNKYGYINKEGKLLIEPTYQMAYPFSEDKAVVVQNNRYYIINLQNEIIYSFNEGITSNSHFACGRLVVEKNHKFGYIKDDFAMATDFIYDSAYPFSENLAAVGKFVGEELLYSYIDTEGNFQTDETGNDVYQYYYASFFNNGYAKVSLSKNDNQELLYGFIDQNQDLKVNCLYVYAQDNIDRFFVVANEFYDSFGKYQGKEYLFLDNNQNINGSYRGTLNRLGIMNDDFVPIDLNNGSYTFSKLVINERYVKYPNGTIADDEKYPWTLQTLKIDSKDDSITKPMGINDFKRGIASFYTNDFKYGLINAKGTVLLEPEFAKIIY